MRWMGAWSEKTVTVLDAQRPCDPPIHPSEQLIKDTYKKRTCAAARTYRHHVWACKVIDDSGRVADAHVPNERKDPSKRQCINTRTSFSLPSFSLSLSPLSPLPNSPSLSPSFSHVSKGMGVQTMQNGNRSRTKSIFPRMSPLAFSIGIQGTVRTVVRQ